MAGGVLALVVALLSAAYSAYSQQRLAVEAERRQTYASFIGDVQACLRPDPELIERVVRDAPTQGPTQSVDVLRAGFQGDLIGCDARVHTGQARVGLLARSPTVAESAFKSASATSEFRKHLYDVWLAFTINDTAALQPEKGEALGEAGRQVAESLALFEVSARDEVGVTDGFLDALVGPSALRLVALASLAAAALAFYRAIRLRSPEPRRSTD